MDFFSTMVEAEWPNTQVMILRMFLACILGAAIAFHPRVYREVLAKKDRLDYAKAQILLALAGSFLVILVGKNMALAMGLFGFGSFVRFRTPVKSAMDSALLFLIIAMGMGIGMGQYLHTISIVAFIMILIAIFDKIPTGVENDEEKSKEPSFKVYLSPDAVSKVKSDNMTI